MNRAKSVATSISSEMSRRAWRYLIALSAACAVLNALRADKVGTGAVGPSDARKALKSRLNPYFSPTEQFASFPFVCSRAAQIPKFSRPTMPGKVASATVAPARRSARTASLNTSSCGAVSGVSRKPPAGFGTPSR